MSAGGIRAGSFFFPQRLRISVDLLTVLSKRVHRECVKGKEVCGDTVSTELVHNPIFA